LHIIPTETYFALSTLASNEPKELIKSINCSLVIACPLVAPGNTVTPFVLATPENYEHFLSRYNSFSYIDAYNTTDDGYLDDDNVIYLFMLPDAKRKLSGSQDYFALPIEEFTFTATEQAAIQKTIEDSGQQMVVTDIEFVTPVIKKYRMDIYVRYFEGFDKNQIFKDIRSKISEYLMNITRRDKLPKSDIIALLEATEGIDAVNVQFVSALEEEARRLGYYYVKTIKVTPSTPVLQDIGNGKQRFFFFEKSNFEISKRSKSITFESKSLA
jgi:hypothetical protein